MALTGYTGISFPFRVGNKGGAVVSTTTRDNPQHIEESIQQILSTDEFERPLEHDVYTDLSTTRFEPNDLSLQSLMKSIIVEDLTRLDDRIDVTERDISFEVDENEGRLYALINYKVIKYDTYYQTRVSLGEVTQ